MISKEAYEGIPCGHGIQFGQSIIRRSQDCSACSGCKKKEKKNGNLKLRVSLSNRGKGSYHFQKDPQYWPFKSLKGVNSGDQHHAELPCEMTTQILTVRTNESNAANRVGSLERNPMTLYGGSGDSDHLDKIITNTEKPLMFIPG
jgi:hypothetical protein